ncbi:MAG: hypothetical protein AAF092_11530 [Pseudomonadota bacterium]
MEWVWRFTVFAVLTILTQLGGLAYAAGLALRRPWLGGFGAYLALSLAATQVAPAMGRVPLPCFSGETRVLLVLCAMNRHYATPEAAAVTADLGKAVPGTVVLDAGFPFIDGFPLLPHLSHDDGRKVDTALYYDGSPPSPLGYFAFEPGPTDCPDGLWPTMRWDMEWFQPLWPERTLDGARLAAAAQFLANDPRVEKLFLEPHLQARLGLSHPKIRFQGCRAARHDDHIHFQVF